MRKCSKCNKKNAISPLLISSVFSMVVHSSIIEFPVLSLCFGNILVPSVTVNDSPVNIVPKNQFSSKSIIEIDNTISLERENVNE